MKKIILLLIIGTASLFLNCHAPSNCDNGKQCYHADEVSFGQYNGKTIKGIQLDSYVTSQHNLVICFTDGTNLTIVANKYVLDIYK